MKDLLIIANWKANKTVEEAKEWWEGIMKHEAGIKGNSEIVICTPYINLPILKEQLAMQQPNNLTIRLGSQDISQFEDGAYTGEVTGRMLKDLAEYVIIGHSERRKYFQETDGILKTKVEKALKFGLKPIYCISEPEMAVPDGVEIIAYEPLFAIGSGTPDTPENANQAAGKIKEKHPAKILYGGSVKPENASSFVRVKNIDGLLIGGASLAPQDFIEIIRRLINLYN